MKVLVTGCAGFIGFHLSKKLLSEGYEVIGVDNLNDYYSPALKKARLKQLQIDAENLKDNEFICNKNNFIFIKSDIESPVLYLQYLNKVNFDIVCHLAAQAGVRYSMENPQQYISSNIQGFFNILEYCRQNPTSRLIFASSSSVYGKNNDIPYKESSKTETPVSLYAATKKSNELFAHSYSELYGITTVGLRFFTVYGPWGRPDMAPALFTKAIMENEPIKVFNGGNMSRDFTYIDDIVEGISKVLFSDPIRSPSKPSNYRIYNIGNSRPVKLNDFISTIEKSADKSAQKTYLPMQPGDVQDTWADTALLQQDYDYTPHTSIEKGLRNYLAWYKKYLKKHPAPKFKSEHAL